MRAIVTGSAILLFVASFSFGQQTNTLSKSHYSRMSVNGKQIEIIHFSTPLSHFMVLIDDSTVAEITFGGLDTPVFPGSHYRSFYPADDRPPYIQLKHGVPNDIVLLIGQVHTSGHDAATIYVKTSSNSDVYFQLYADGTIVAHNEKDVQTMW